jgi:PIN domain nuclease of toxin-antitoxin system
MASGRTIVIICDTHVLLYWAISPERLSPAAAEALVQGRTSGRLARAQDAAFQHGDPADRLIAATALVHGAVLISADRQLAQVRGLQLLW